MVYYCFRLGSAVWTLIDLSKISSSSEAPSSISIDFTLWYNVGFSMSKMLFHVYIGWIPSIFEFLYLGWISWICDFFICRLFSMDFKLFILGLNLGNFVIFSWSFGNFGIWKVQKSSEYDLNINCWFYAYRENFDSFSKCSALRANFWQ